MPKKSKKTNKKRKKPGAKRTGAKKASPKGSKKKATPATKKVKPSAPTLAGMGFAAGATSVVSAVVVAGCLPYPLAEALVYKCGSPEADGVPSSTSLGDLFGGARLTGFCQCVANGVPCSPSKVPCSASKTLQDVVDAIACK